MILFTINKPFHGVVGLVLFSSSTFSCWVNQKMVYQMVFTIKIRCVHISLIFFERQCCTKFCHVLGHGRLSQKQNEHLFLPETVLNLLHGPVERVTRHGSFFQIKNGSSRDLLLSLWAPALWIYYRRLRCVWECGCSHWISACFWGQVAF